MCIIFNARSRWTKHLEKLLIWYGHGNGRGETTKEDIQIKYPQQKADRPTNVYGVLKTGEKKFHRMGGREKWRTRIRKPYMKK